MPEIARDVRPSNNYILACNVPSGYYIPKLVGDVHALARIDLDREGLSEYKHQLSHLLQMRHVTHIGGHGGSASELYDGSSLHRSSSVTNLVTQYQTNFN